jgi:hypothetical protein
LGQVGADDFDAVFCPGGHGPLWNLAEDAQSIALIEKTFAAGKPWPWRATRRACCAAPRRPTGLHW